MLRLCTAFVLGLLSAGAGWTGALSGPARVIDGDTLDVAGVRVRLHGIDAPERDQACRTEQGVSWACGAWATGQVRARLQGRRVDCNPLGTDRYGRTLARCSTAGEDVGRRLVLEGIAFAYERYSSDYLPEQAIAQAADAGLWSGSVEAPAAFRQAARQPDDAPPSCAIKGNISENGRILHEPGSRMYDRTRIDTARGERWFCSVDEAEAAGWRRPGA
jgi:endonuclease YncB( thermonuclease family)